MVDHSVAEGECLSSIAFRYGFHWQTLWDHPGNTALRRLRANPFALEPGDVVRIPPLEPARFTRSTGAKHTFHRKGVPAKLRVRLLDDAGAARGGLAYALVVDGREAPGSHRTDGDGWIDHFIAPDAALAVMTLTESREEFRFLLGRVQPIGTLVGVQARLASLGFFDGAIDGAESDALDGAVQDFQVAYGLDPSGVIDDQTRDKLRDAFGG